MPAPTGTDHPDITVTDSLGEHDVARARLMVDGAAAADGISPLSEQAVAAIADWVAGRANTDPTAEALVAG